MKKYLTISECQAVVNQVCQKLCVPDFAENITIKFRPGMVSSMGIAYPTGIIHLSKGLFERATAQERYNTIVHEICHVATDWITHYGADDTYDDGYVSYQAKRAYQWLFGNWKPKYPTRPHGKEWKTLMLELGQKPKPCHNIEPIGMPNTFKAKCSCQMYTFSNARKKWLSNYFCKQCDSRLKMVRS